MYVLGYATERETVADGSPVMNGPMNRILDRVSAECISKFETPPR